MNSKEDRGKWVFEKENWVVQSNKLIEAQIRSSLLEKKIFVAVVMQIQPSDEDFKKYVVDANRIMEELDIKQRDFYREIDKATDNLLARNVVIEREDEKSFTKISLMNYASYSNGILTLKVNEDMKPYLLNLNRNFTKYQIKNVLELKSVYSVRLYELMRERHGIGGRMIYLDDLRKMLGIREDEYTRYADFEKRVLKKSIEEINEKTDLKIDYEKIKIGRMVDQIKFTIEVQEESGVDKALAEYFGITYPIDKMKDEMGIENLRLSAGQIIDLYTASAEKLEGMGNVKTTEERIYRLVRANLEYTKKMKPDVSFYGYLLKAVREDMAREALMFFAEDMGMSNVLSTPKPIVEEIDEEAERSAGYNFEW